MSKTIHPAKLLKGLLAPRNSEGQSKSDFERRAVSFLKRTAESLGNIFSQNEDGIPAEVSAEFSVYSTAVLKATQDFVVKTWSWACTVPGFEESGNELKDALVDLSRKGMFKECSRLASLIESGDVEKGQQYVLKVKSSAAYKKAA